jgi:sugar fermentation stimulation protein A
MLFDRPLVPAVLIQRYKRFLCDAVLEDGRAITGSCPNTGSMRGLTTPGSRIWLSEHDSPTRKYQHMFEMVEVGGTVVGINTGLPNRLAEEAIRAGQVGDLHLYATIQREQKYGRNSRIDMLLSDPERGRAYVEVKNVHFSRSQGLAEFPDSPTARGCKASGRTRRYGGGRPSRHHDLSDPARRLHKVKDMLRSRPGLCNGVPPGHAARG